MTSTALPSSFESFAQQLDCADAIGRDHATILTNVTFVMDGWGAVARPLSEQLASLGARRFLLTDPKQYVPRSVGTQCREDEVGRLKVAVGADRLRQLGAEVISFAQDIKTVPAGVVAPHSIVITSVDNRRADIVSNRRAARMGARFLKVNVEPSPGIEVAAVRSYNFRQNSAPCVECQFTASHYAAQRHPQSCDGSSDGRRTNSPTWLSRAAAQLGLLAALDLAADGAGAERWFNHERQYFPQTGHVCDSRLQPKADCRFDHTLRWPKVTQLPAMPADLSLRDLLQMAEMAIDTRVQIRFCQQLALRGRCDKCRKDFSIVRWFADLRAAVGSCPSCDGALLPIPFAAFSVTSLEPLLTVLEQPLSHWGVPRFALIELAHDERCEAFVVGGAACFSNAGA